MMALVWQKRELKYQELQNWREACFAETRLGYLTVYEFWDNGLKAYRFALEVDRGEGNHYADEKMDTVTPLPINELQAEAESWLLNLINHTEADIKS